MSFSTAKYIYPSSKWWAVFSGGIVNNTPNTHLADHFSPYGRNFRISGASIINRPWHQTFATLSGSLYPKGIGSYLRSSSANDVMVIRQTVDSTHKLVTLTTGGTQTSIDTASIITAETRMNFVNIGDLIFCMDGTTIWQLSGTTFTDIKTSSGLAGLSLNAPKFWVTWANCHWVGWFATSWQTVRKSVVDDPDNFSGSGSQSLLFPENVTGLGTANTTLFTFTKNTINATTAQDVQDNGTNLTFDSKSIQATEGAICHGSIVSVGNELYYLSSSNKICKIARWANIYGFEVVELSDLQYKGISTFMNTLDSDQSDSFAQYYPEQNLIKWFLKSKGSTILDTCVIYDTESEQFIFDTNKYFYDAVYFYGQVYSISGITPTVFRDEYLNTDDWSGIDFEYWTKAFDEWEATLKKWYWESRTDVSFSELASLTQETWINSRVDEVWNYEGTLTDSITVDNTSIEVSSGWLWSEPIGEFPIGEEGYDPFNTYNLTILRTKGNLNVRGYSIQYRFTNSAPGSSIRLKRLGYKREVLSGLTTDLTLAACAFLCTELLATLITESGNSLIL